MPANTSLRRACAVTVIAGITTVGSVIDATAARPIPMRQRIVEAISVTRLCPHITVNRRVFERIARANGMNPKPGSRDMRVLELTVRQQVPRLATHHRKLICRLGEVDFGPRGIIIRNLLKTR